MCPTACFFGAFSKARFISEHPCILELFMLGLGAASALADEKMMMSTNKIF